MIFAENIICIYGHDTESVVQRPRRSLRWDGTGPRKPSKLGGGNGTRAGSPEVTRTRESPPDNMLGRGRVLVCGLVSGSTRTPSLEPGTLIPRKAF